MINARAIGDPAQLSRLVAESLESLASAVEITSREAFRPVAAEAGAARHERK